MKLTCCALLTVIALAYARNPKVVLPGNVTIEGKMVDINDKNAIKLNGYYGIPYAKKAESLFSIPAMEEFEPESNIKAMQPGSQCPQFSLIPKRESDSEEKPSSGAKLLEEIYSLQGAAIDPLTCRNLNVFVRDDVANDGQKKPVVIFIHGGSFASGGNNSSAYSMEQIYRLDAVKSVIFVQPNYSLGAFGSLAFEEDDSGEPLANLTFHELIASLRWTQNYIGAFGGDADRIFLWGHSAGGALVGWQHVILTQFPELAKSVKGIWQMSGTGFLVPAISIEESFERTREFAARAGCGDKHKAELLKCLRKKPWEEIVAIGNHSDFIWRPVVDGKLIHTPYFESLTKQNFKQGIRVALSVTKDECSLFVMPKKEDLEKFVKSSEGSIHEALLREKCALQGKECTTKECRPCELKKWDGEVDAKKTDGADICKKAVALGTKTTFDFHSSQVEKACKRTNTPVMRFAFELCEIGFAAQLALSVFNTFSGNKFSTKELGSFHGADIGALFDTKIRGQRMTAIYTDSKLGEQAISPLVWLMGDETVKETGSNEEGDVDSERLRVCISGQICQMQLTQAPFPGLTKATSN